MVWRLNCFSGDFIAVVFHFYPVFGLFLNFLYSNSQNVPVGANNRPKLPVVISQCGEM